MSNLSPEEKKAKFKKMREFHQPTLDRIGASTGFLLAKLPYFPPGKDEKCIAIFENELGKGVDLYVEFADKDLEPQDPERGLYKWRYNASYKEEYDSTDAPVRYLIPVKELIPIPKAGAAKASAESFSLRDPELDEPMERATLRDLAAIMWKKPVSQKPWLNEFINKHK